MTGETNNFKYYRDSVLAEVNNFYKMAKPKTGTRGIKILHDNVPAHKLKLAQNTYTGEYGICVTPSLLP